MNPVQQTVSVIGTPDTAVHALLAAGGKGFPPPEPEQLMAEIELRATQVGAILQGILEEPHAEPRWGLNE